MTTYSVGPATSANVLSTLYDVDFAPDFASLWGEDGKFTKFIDSLGKPEQMISNATYWGYSEHRGVNDTMAATAATTDVDLKVTTPSLWKPNEVVLHPTTGDTAVIDSVNTATSFVHVIGRGRGGIAAATLTSGDEIINLGSAYTDGDSTSQARMVVDTSAVNYAQIFWENVEFGIETLAINKNKGLLGGDYEDRKRAEALNALNNRLDLAHLFGSAVSSTPRTMGGVANYIDATTTATVATLTELLWEQHLETKAAIYGNMDKLVVTGNKVLGGMNRWASAKFALADVGGEAYGYSLKKYKTPIMDLDVMPHQMFSTSAALGQRALILNKRSMQRAVLLPLKLAIDIDSGTKLTRMDAWVTICSARWGHPKHHSQIKGITAITA